MLFRGSKILISLTWLLSVALSSDTLSDFPTSTPFHSAESTPFHSPRGQALYRPERTQSLPARLNHTTPQAQRLFGRLHYQAALRGRPRIVPEQLARLRASPATHTAVLDSTRMRLDHALAAVRELLAQHLESCELRMWGIRPADIGPPVPADQTFPAWHGAGPDGLRSGDYLATWLGVRSHHERELELAHCAPLRAELARLVPGLREERSLLLHARDGRTGAGEAADRARLAEARALLVEAQWARRLGEMERSALWQELWEWRRRLQPPLRAPWAERRPDGGAGAWRVARGPPLPWAQMWLAPHHALCFTSTWYMMGPGWNGCVGRDIPFFCRPTIARS